MREELDTPLRLVSLDLLPLGLSEAVLQGRIGKFGLRSKWQSLGEAYDLNENPAGTLRINRRFSLFI